MKSGGCSYTGPARRSERIGNHLPLSTSHSTWHLALGTSHCKIPVCLPFPSGSSRWRRRSLRNVSSAPDWIFERKFDGIRLIAYKQRRDVRLFSRNRLLQNASYPSIVAAIAALPVRDVILDGEATGVWGSQGRVTYHVFDILFLDGRLLTSARSTSAAPSSTRCRCDSPLERVDAAGRCDALGQGVPRGLGRRRSPSGATRRTSTAARSTG